MVIFQEVSVSDFDIVSTHSILGLEQIVSNKAGAKFCLLNLGMTEIQVLK